MAIIDCAEAICGSCRNVYVTARGRKGALPGDLFRNVADLVRRENLAVVSLETFGISNAAGLGTSFLKDAFGDVTFPVTWIEEGCELASPAFGCQAWCVDRPVAPVRLGGRVVGSLFEDDCATYCRLGGLGGPVEDSQTGQTRAVFDTMVAALGQTGMTFGNVVRTWFYNYRMLEWYDDFNEVRTTYFKEHGVFDGLVPASTAVGGRNGFGGALTSGLLALKPKSGAVSVQPVVSPLQCPAFEYGSAFSRAVEIGLPGQRRLLISGTASIEPGGKSLHIGNVEAQVGLTMDVVEAILESRDMGWKNVSRALAYFKSDADIAKFEPLCTAKRIPRLPALAINNDICRDDLLFEIELDAIGD